MTRSYDPLCNRRPNRSRPGHHPRIALANGLVAAQDQQMMTALGSGQPDRLLSTAFCRMTDNGLAAFYTTTLLRHRVNPQRPLAQQIHGAQAPSLGPQVSIPIPTPAQQRRRRRALTVSRLSPELGGWRSRFIALDPVSNALNTNHDIMTGTGEPWHAETLIDRSGLAIDGSFVF